MAEITEFDPKPVAPAKCSFCGKPKSKVKVLIGEAGHACICNYCLAKCTKLLEEDTAK